MFQGSMMQSKMMRSRPISFVRNVLLRLNIKSVKLIQYQRNLEGLDRGIALEFPTSVKILSPQDISDPIILDALIPKGIIRDYTKRVWIKRYERERDRLEMEILKRMELGDVCLLQFNGEVPSGYVWLSYGRKRLEPAIEHYILPEKNEAIIHSLYIDPQHRNKGFGRQVIMQALSYLSTSTKCTSVMVFIKKDNLISQRSFRANAFKPVKVFSFVRFFWYSKLEEKVL